MDESELIDAAKRGDVNAQEKLLLDYMPRIHFLAKTYYLPGADKDDLMQEAMLAFMVAVRAFDPAQGQVFKYFADFVVRRRVISAVKTATRLKHLVLNRATSIDAPIYGALEEEGRTLADILPDASQGCAESVIEQELAQKVRDAIVYDAGLTALETRVFMAYLIGLPYKKMAKRLGLTLKNCDNALQRCKNKIDRALRSLAKEVAP